MMGRRTSSAAVLRGSIKGALLGLLGAAAVIAVAAAVVWPLWYLATSFTAVYTALALVAIGAGLVVVVARRIRARRANAYAVAGRALGDKEPGSTASESAIES